MPKPDSKNDPRGAGLSIDDLIADELDAELDGLDPTKPLEGLSDLLEPEEEVVEILEVEPDLELDVDVVEESADAPKPAEPPRGTPISRRIKSVRLQPGTVLSSYRVLSRIGSGGMGDVYLVEHIHLGRKFALKRLHDQFLDDPGFVKRFFEEARKISQIMHPHLIEITDFITDGDNRCFVMEFLDGDPLATRLERGAFSIGKVLDIGAQLCDALAAVHGAGIIHRDLKPENVMLVQRQGKVHLKLLDFGIAKFTDESGAPMNQTAAGMALGTPGYMAPEQLLEDQCDHRADIYALGIVLYQMLTGQKPFVADTWPKLLLKHSTETPKPPSDLLGHSVPEGLEALVLKCLEKDPKNRPQSAKEIASELRRFAAGDTTPGAGMRRPRKKKRLLPLVAALTVLLGAGVGGATFVFPQYLPWTRGAQPAAAPAMSKADAPDATKDASAEPEGEPAASEPGESDDAAGPESSEPEAGEATASEVDTPSKPEAATSSKKRRRKTRTVKSSKATAEPATSKPEPEPEPEPRGAVASAPPASKASAVDEHYQKSLELLKAKKARLAVEELKKAIAINPRHAPSYRMLGTAYILMGGEAKAVKAFEKFVELAPNHKDAPKLRKVIEQYKNK